MRLRLVHARVWLLVLLLAVVGLASVQLAAAPAVQPKRASFDISNAFTVKVPEGAKRVRVWFAVPQGVYYSAWAATRPGDGRLLFANAAWRDKSGTEVPAPQPLAAAVASGATEVSTPSQANAETRGTSGGASP